MAEDNSNPVEGQDVDNSGLPVDNVKSEMNRKFDNLNSQIAQQNQQMQALLNQIASNAKPAEPAVPQRALKDLVYDDPDAFVKRIVAEASAATNQQIDQRVNLSTATQQVIADLQERYPEFAQANGPAAKMALDKANRLPAGLRGTPEGFRLAMLDAVNELGLTQASKRTTQSADDFVAGGNTGSTSRAPRAGNDPKKGIDPMTLAFAEAMGVDVNDPKRLEGLKQASGRKTWNRYT